MFITHFLGFTLHKMYEQINSQKILVKKYIHMYLNLQKLSI